MFRVKKSNHSKKIVKQLKKEYKEDLERSGFVKQEIKSGGNQPCVHDTSHVIPAVTLAANMTAP